MIKLIAVDMDGTLVNSQHQISETNVAAIKAAQSQGIEFIITTGRSYEDAAPQVEAVNIECNYLVMNGSELRNSKGEIVQSLYLEKKLVIEIVAELAELGLFVELYTTGGTFSTSGIEESKWAVATKINNFHPEISLEEAYVDAEDHFLYKSIRHISSLNDIFENGFEVGKVISFSPKKGLLADLRRMLPQRFPINVTGSFAINLEITNPLGDKGEALKRYAQKRGIDLQEIMTIGDSYNDLGMLSSEFGYPVAMGNAIPEVKGQAKYVTETNNADGVGKAINRFI